MEKLQERGLRFVYNDSETSYTDLLAKTNKNMLYINRIKKIALFVFKCVNKIGPPSVYDLYTKKSVPYGLRDPNKIEQSIPNTTSFGLQNLKYSGASLWNQMPGNLKETIELNTFKSLIKTWAGPSCKCGACTMCKISQM